MTSSHAPRSFHCYLVEKQSSGDLAPRVTEVDGDRLPADGVIVRVRYSSLNYKDALAATGQAGIVKTYPHVPGIDVAGHVEHSIDPRFEQGDAVLTTGHELGVERWGGWAEYIRVPADWLIPLPSGLSLLEAMQYGTAGFTAAQCVQALQRHGVHPGEGEVIVTGATGGVGSLAVMILAKLGYHVVAVTGKQDQADWLRHLGAAEVAGRDLLSDQPKRPLLTARFRGGVDTVGGDLLASLLKQIKQRGCVACCGLTAGANLPTTVYPFILRGVTLAGIDSVWCPDAERGPLWKLLATDWKSPYLSEGSRRVGLDDLAPEVDTILRGGQVGRVVVML